MAIHILIQNGDRTHTLNLTPDPNISTEDNTKWMMDTFKELYNCSKPITLPSEPTQEGLLITYLPVDYLRNSCFSLRIDAVPPFIETKE